MKNWILAVLAGFSPVLFVALIFLLVYINPLIVLWGIGVAVSALVVAMMIACTLDVKEHLEGRK